MADPPECERGSGDPCVEGSGQDQPFRPPTEDETMEVPTPELHRPVDPSQAEIRLIRFELNQTSNVPKVSLEIFSLDSDWIRHPFCALSYEWNPPCEVGQPQRTLILDGKEIKVSQTLGAAVAQVAEFCISDRFLLWVDALCINQGDLAEKSHQVQLMRRIYQTASFVLIWPGSLWEMSAAKAEPPVPHLLEQLTKLLYEATHKHDAPNRCEGFQSIVEDHPLHWKAFKSLFSITYWQRCWIVQELVLAQQSKLVCVVYCATRSTYDTVFVDISRLMVYVHQITLEEYSCSPNSNTHRTELFGPRVLDTFPAAYRIRFTYPQEHYDLLQLLLRFSSQQSTERSDKVYSLLGIARFRTNQTLDVDYTLASAEVFKKTAAYIIHDSGTLDILTFAASGSRDLPTWVPDWSEDVYINSSIARGFSTWEQAWRIPYRSRIETEKIAESARQFPPQISADLSSLTVTALLCDLALFPNTNRASTNQEIDEAVRQIREIMHVTNKTNRHLYDLAQTEHNWPLHEFFLVFYWHELFRSGLNSGPRLDYTCFSNIVRTGQFSTDKRQAESERTLLGRALRGTRTILTHFLPEVGSDLFVSDQVDDKQSTDLWNLIRQHQIHLYLPGIVCSERFPQPFKQEEHLLAILHCRTPIILRKVAGKVKDYEVVTWAYVPLCEEGLSRECVKEWPLEEITLV